MSCPHSTRSDCTPASCSLCLGAEPQRVSIEPGAVADIPLRDYYRRGGRHSGNHPRTKKT